jgi:hypothetical protein
MKPWKAFLLVGGAILIALGLPTSYALTVTAQFR